MTIKNLKNEKGFAAQDALIAVLIISLFTGLIAVLIYNIYLSNSSLKRMTKATEYITNIFEYADKLYYDYVNGENLATINDNYLNLELQYDYSSETYETYEEFETENDVEYNLEENMQRLYVLVGQDGGYNITILIDKYAPTADSLDLVKQITVIVSYKLGSKMQNIEMSMVKQRENLKSPNVPSIENIEGKKAYPIKKVNNKWKVCKENDASWYNYESGLYATIAYIDEDEVIKVGDEIDITSEEIDIKVWIPRYAYNEDEEDLIFLYSNTNNYVEINNGYTILNTEELENYDIYDGDDENETTGFWTENSEEEEYVYLDSIYENKQEIW